jgi:hypothetical protein
LFPPPSPALTQLRQRLSTASDEPDDVVADVLTAGYAQLLELEADHVVAGRRVDELLDRGDEQEVLAAVRTQGHVSALIRGLRTDLAELAAIRRRRREAGSLPRDH